MARTMRRAMTYWCGGSPVAALNCREVVGAVVGDCGQLRQGRAGVEVPLDVLDDGAGPPRRARPGSGARQGQIPQVGNGRKLSGFYGKCGFKGVKCGKYGIRKLRNSLFLRLFRPAPPEWGSGHFTGKAIPQLLSVIEIAIRARLAFA